MFEVRNSHQTSRMVSDLPDHIWSSDNPSSLRIPQFLTTPFSRPKTVSEDGAYSSLFPPFVGSEHTQLRF